MDFTRYYHIAFKHHRIMNPLSDDTLAFIGRHALIEPGSAVLDIGSGKGYASLVFAREFRARTTQVDVSEQWTSCARRLFADEGLGHLAEIHTMDADRFMIDPGRYRLILCFGTTPVYGGFAEALERMRGGLDNEGMIAVGEISCEGTLRKPLRGYLNRHDWRIYQMSELLDSVADAGMAPVFVIRSTAREWDLYMSLQWKAIGDFARAHPDNPESRVFEQYMREEQEIYLRFQRDAVNWNVFVLKTR